jgi:hypothetical protein
MSRRATPMGLLKVAVGLLLAAWMVMPASGPAGRAVAADGATAEVQLKALVPADAQPFLNAASKGLAGSSVVTSPDLEIGGTRDLRTTFIEGQGDVVVSGADFTEPEKLVLSKAGKEVVSAPVQAVGLAFFGFVPPLPTFPDGCEEDDTCLERRQAYDGPIRFAPDVLANFYFERSNVWSDDQFLAALEIPAGRFFFPPIKGPRPLVRTEPDASNLYLESYLATTSPAIWALSRKELPGATANPQVSETWPNSVTPSRLGMDNVVSQVREGLDPGSSELSFGGTITAGSVSLVEESFTLNVLRPAAQRVPMFRVQVRNAAGEWVLPSTESITAAVAAGEGIPNAGSVGVAVPGAYPITWVNKLYAPTTGLGADKANAVAALIRWQVTAGQTDAALKASGDGKLTPKLVATALAAADQVVKSNCAAAKGAVKTSRSAGGTAPAGGFPGLDEVTYCVGPSTETTTDSPVEESAASDFGSSEFDTSFSDTGLVSSELSLDTGTAGEEPSVLGETATNEPASASGTAGTAQGTQFAMPFGVPGQSLPPLDRAATIGMGALAYAGIRSYRRRTA